MYTKVCYKMKPAIIIDERYLGHSTNSYEVLIEQEGAQFWVLEDDLEEIDMVKDKGYNHEFYGDY